MNKIISSDFNIANIISKKKLRLKTTTKDNFELFLFTLPVIISLILFNYVPMFGVVMAFKDFRFNKGIWGSNWNGFKNFEFFFRSQDAWRVTRNTVGYNSAFIVIGIICSVIVALLLYEVTSRLATKTYQTIMILPHFMSWVIVSYISYMLLNPELGLINKILQSINLKPIQWYADTTYWPVILTTFNVWKTVGMGSVMYYAALMGIDASLFEAAKIDGANRFKQIIHISIPSITPIIIILFILSVGNIMGGDFGLFYQITRDSGTLYPVTDIIPTYVFRTLQGGSYAVGSAVGLFQSIINLALVVSANSIVRKVQSESSLF